MCCGGWNTDVRWLDRMGYFSHTVTMQPTLLRRLLVPCVLATLLFVGAVAALGRPAAASGFAEAVARLSEPEGAFDTDNLISNERGYLQVIPALVSGAVVGGAYIGVGPDQNFS